MLTNNNNNNSNKKTCSPLHGRSSTPKYQTRLIFLLLPLFVKDPHVQGRYYATPVANVDSNIPDKHHDCM